MTKTKQKDARSDQDASPDTVEKRLPKALSPKWARWVATGLGVGYFPLMPGTLGSLLGVCLFLVLRPLPPILYLLTFITFVLLGVYTAGLSEPFFQKKDASEIVIDEIVTMMGVLFLIPPSVGWWFAGFVAFRVFDILKPPPCRQLERLPGGWGVMADDLLAGAYTVVFLQLLALIFNDIPGGWWKS
ncbi:MAG: phosphatidylglycerophosphatase A [Candidatus Manganitrophus sp. SA1]|nr:phosphatidylglycerophosphatase A [Candidatus Manganitrophus morganii]